MNYRHFLVALLLFVCTSVSHAVEPWIGKAWLGGDIVGTCAAYDGNALSCITEFQDQWRTRYPSCIPLALSTYSSYTMPAVGSFITFAFSGPCGSTSLRLYTVSIPAAPSGGGGAAETSSLGVTQAESLLMIFFAMNVMVFGLGFVGGQQR